MSMPSLSRRPQPVITQPVTLAAPRMSRCSFTSMQRSIAHYFLLEYIESSSSGHSCCRGQSSAPLKRVPEWFYAALHECWTKASLCKDSACVACTTAKAPGVLTIVPAVQRTVCSGHSPFYKAASPSSMPSTPTEASCQNSVSSKSFS